MERSRITPRLRPRPYDLRRKVLLKNFFREQMTYIPLIRSTAELSSDVNNNDDEDDENDSNSNNTNEGNILTPKIVQDNIVTPIAAPEPVPSTSNCSEKENSNNLESSSVADETLSVMGETEEKPSSKFSRFSRIIETIDSRLSSRKNRRKGITKAKHELRSSKSIMKPAGRKIIKDNENSTKVKSKSIFERFKSRRGKKRNKTATTSKVINFFSSKNTQSNKSDSKVATTSTQSCQTDMSWSPDHYDKMEQSNRSLLEENRLLSESLSNIITNTDFRSGSMQNSCCTDSYTDSSDNSYVYFNAEPQVMNNKIESSVRCVKSDAQRSRILRSKSMQTRSEKRTPAPSRLRTRSMNRHYIKRPYNTDSFVSGEQFNEPEHCSVNPVPSRCKSRPSVLQSIDTSPLYNTSLPPLQTFSKKPGKAVVRRSSMPERTCNWSMKARPMRSSSMRENNYSYTKERVSPRPNPSNRRRRSNTFNGYPSPVPFHKLPAVAFY